MASGCTRGATRRRAVWGYRRREERRGRDELSGGERYQGGSPHDDEWRSYGRSKTSAPPGAEHLLPPWRVAFGGSPRRLAAGHRACSTRPLISHLFGREACASASLRRRVCPPTAAALLPDAETVCTCGPESRNR